MIRNLTPRPAEKGRVKIGGLGEERKKRDGSGTYMLPVKYDSFKIVTMQRDAAGRFIEDKGLMERLMQAQGVEKLLEIPIRLLFDDPDLNFFTRYAAYSGKSVFCSGDGVEAQRIGKDGKYAPRSCPCEHLEADYQGQIKCKPWGSLRFLIEGVDRVGGVWSFKTTSWNTTNAILSSMVLIKAITGGPLAGIPLLMVLSPKTVSTPDGKSMVAYIVSLEYRGPEEQLAQIGYDIAKRRIEHQIRMETVEVEARKLLVAPHEESPEEQAATAAEFYPTQGQDQGNGDDLKPKALTLPELMDLAKKNDACVELPIPLETSKGVHIGRWLEWGLNLQEELVVTIELVSNLPEVSNGLTTDMIEKSFKEAKINLAIVEAMAEEEAQERIAGQEQETVAPQVAQATKGPQGNGGQRKSLF